MLRRVLQKPIGLAAFLFPVIVVLENKLTPLFLVGALACAVLFVRPLRPRLWFRRPGNGRIPSSRPEDY